MSENPELSQDPQGVSVPTPFPGEALLCARDGMQIEVAGLRGKKCVPVASVLLAAQLQGATYCAACLLAPPHGTVNNRAIA